MNLTIAAIQMIAAPAPTAERLARAESLVSRAAGLGAQLVALPEMFNTGYEYHPRNYALAEPLDGPTPAWMRSAAARHGVHLAGAFLRRAADGEIYNTLLLAAPDGQEWLYDKSYPWMWERAYFRPGNGPQVAATSLGKIGLMICWDVAHTGLWQAYAGQVQLVLACSCPPAVHDFTLQLPDGRQVSSADISPSLRRVQRAADETFGQFLRRQSTHLGVPVVNVTGTGNFASGLPRPRYSLAGMAATCPRLWKYLGRAGEVRMTCGYFNETYLADARGQVLGRVPAGAEDLVAAEIPLPGAPPRPASPPPAYGLPRDAYLLDAFANASVAGEYRRGRNGKV